MLEQVINGRQKLFWELLAEVPVRFVEWELVDADHAFGTNKSQPEYELFQMSKLEAVQTFGKLVEGYNLKLMQFGGKPSILVTPDESQSVGSDLQEIQEFSDV
jgi:hypothetical protein